MYIKYTYDKICLNSPSMQLYAKHSFVHGTVQLETQTLQTFVLVHIHSIMNV